MKHIVLAAAVVLAPIAAAATPSITGIIDDHILPRFETLALTSQALSDAALEALDGRFACLLANHGAITLGVTLDKALALSVELEALARQYLLRLAAGGPVLLSKAEIAAALEAFAGYGRQG